MQFKRYTKPGFLKQVGRELLEELFGQFRGELAAKGLDLPPAELADWEYYEVLARLVLDPAGLPESLLETLHALEEMSNAQGQERLEAAAVQAGIKLKAESTPGDIAVQVWLARPELLAEKHNEVRLGRLASFEY